MTKIVTEGDAMKQIEDIVKNNDVVLFMKGTADMPICGFSSIVSRILQNLGVTFKDINVLSDENLRQTIKKYSDWPTIPQLYVKEEFIGGCDIIKEMYESGDLQKLLKNKNVI